MKNYNGVLHRAYIRRSKTLIICLAVSTEYRCDRRTDGQTAFNSINSIVRGVERLCKAENQKAESQQAEFKRQKIKWQINQKAEKNKRQKICR